MRWSSSVVIGMFFLLAGCAQPVYETRYKGEPPSDKRGQTCARKADSDRDFCLVTSESRHKICVRDGLAQAQPLLDAALALYQEKKVAHDDCTRVATSAYEDALNKAYQDALWDAQQALNQCNLTKKANEYCTIDEPTKYEISQSYPLYRYVSEECGYGPREPEMADYFKEESCGPVHGSCWKQYEYDYRTCGGEVKAYEVCIKNCD